MDSNFTILIDQLGLRLTDIFVQSLSDSVVIDCLYLRFRFSLYKLNNLLKYSMLYYL